MSVTPIERTIAVEERAVMPPHRVDRIVRRATDVPAVHHRARPKAKSRKATSSAILAVGQVLAFTSVAGLVWSVSNLAGQVFVEKARRETSVATLRASLLERKESELKVHLDALARDVEIAEWARTHGYVPEDSLPVASSGPNLYAMRR